MQRASELQLPLSEPKKKSNGGERRRAAEGGQRYCQAGEKIHRTRHTEHGAWSTEHSTRANAALCTYMTNPPRVVWDQ